MTVSPPAEPRAGGSFLIERHEAEGIQTPEGFDDELRLIGQTARRFVEREILPDFERLEGLDYDLSRQKILEAGELGLMAIDIPEAYGGLDSSKTASLLVAEKLAASGSFNVTFNAHASIGTLPIVYFGTEEQKQKYLPRLMTGELVGAYCLTEPGSGSDARAAKTRAVPSEDGSEYRLTGTKMWITNAGFADLFTIFAQVETDDGPQFSAFLVERDTPGLSFGAEEKKMGIKGSSTRQVILEDAPVPAANLLGEVGKGHKIAFSILNLGRLKLAAGATGGIKEMLRQATRYATEREQFGGPIARFGLIREKVGEMAANAFALESAVYRVAGELDRRAVAAQGPEERLAALDEFIVEYSLIKVFGSEILDDAIDETLQIFGGIGYSAEYPVELAYRNSRINRIFEGTNEINRLIVSGQLLRRAMSGRLDLLPAGQAALQGTPPEPISTQEPLVAAVSSVEGLKRATLLVATAAAMHFQQDIEGEQELLARLADMTGLVYLSESALLRAERLLDGRTGDAGVALARLFTYASLDRARLLAHDALRRIPGGDAHRETLESYLSDHGADLIDLRRQAADLAFAAGGYPLE